MQCVVAPRFSPTVSVPCAPRFRPWTGQTAVFARPKERCHAGHRCPVQAEHIIPLRPSNDTNRFALPAKSTFQVRALCVAERIDTKAIEGRRAAAASPLFRVGTTGVAAVFRYGAVVFFDVPAGEQEAFLSDISGSFRDGLLEKRQEEEARVSCELSSAENVLNGLIQLSDIDLEKLELIADALAKSVKLAHYESSIDHAFRQVEPLAAELHRKGEAGRQAKKLVKQIGSALLIEHQMVWRMQVSEKPDLLWDRPDLERLYARLQDEYELKERSHALELKLGLLARTISTVLNLLHNKRSLHVEYYIVALIVFEIALSLYDRVVAVI